MARRRRFARHRRRGQAQPQEQAKGRAPAHPSATPGGTVSDRTARQENVGGEILCKVY